jgi:hypothetical protein
MDRPWRCGWRPRPDRSATPDVADCPEWCGGTDFPPTPSVASSFTWLRETVFRRQVRVPVTFLHIPRQAGAHVGKISEPERNSMLGKAKLRNVWPIHPNLSIEANLGFPKGEKLYKCREGNSISGRAKLRNVWSIRRNRERGRI